MILLDLKMPRMTGLQVLQVLRRVRGDEHHRVPPVVVLTCSDDDRDMARASGVSPQSYVCKPTDLGEFTQAVGETLDYWLGLNRAAPRRRLAEADLQQAVSGASS